MKFCDRRAPFRALKRNPWWTFPGTSAGRKRLLSRTSAQAQAQSPSPSPKEIPARKSSRRISPKTRSRSHAKTRKELRAAHLYEGDLLGNSGTQAPGTSSNPPYIPDSGKAPTRSAGLRSVARALRRRGRARHHPQPLKQTENRLRNRSPVLLEIGSEQADTLKAEAANYPWLEWTGALKDFCGNIRFAEYRAK